MITKIKISNKNFSYDLILKASINSYILFLMFPQNGNRYNRYLRYLFYV